MQDRRTTLAALVSIVLAAATGPALAQTWPSAPLRIIVPNVPGGSSDIIARVISQPLSQALGQPVVVENKPGANGNIGAAFAAQATDNHTVLLCDLPSLAISPSVYKQLPYDLGKDLQGVAMLAYSPHLFVVNPSVPANNLKEFIAPSKKSPVNVALPGTATSNHLVTVQLAQATGIVWTHVPYKGGAQALTDTVAGNTQAVVNGQLATMPMVKSNKLKVIAVSSKARSPLLPNVPTIAETIPGFDYSGWQGFLLPKGTPKAISAKLRAAVTQMAEQPDFKKQMVTQATEIVVRGPEEFRKVIADSMVP